MTAIHKPQASLSAGYCGNCREPVRAGEICCGYHIGWISPDGLAWLDYEEYVAAVAGGIIEHCRKTGERVPDDVLALDPDWFLAAVSDADITELLRLAYEENWSADKLMRHWKAKEPHPRK